MASTVLAAKRAVRDVVQSALTAAGEADVVVLWGAPDTAPDFPLESVMVGDVTTTRERPRVGPRVGDEMHKVTVTIVARNLDATTAGQEAATGRALTLFDLVDTYLRSAPGEALTASAVAAGVYLGQIVGDVDLVEIPPDSAGIRDGRWASVTAAVTVKSRRT